MTMRILSIDGGGIRGILPGEILVSLEEKLKKESKNPDARIGDYFDLIAGTSTGAILGAAYICPNKKGKPKFSAREVANIYLEEGDDIFDVQFLQFLRTVGGIRDEKYSAHELERVLKYYFKKIKLSELLKPTCFVSYDIKNRKQIIFRQHCAKTGSEDFLVRDLLRGSSAAPTYFEAARIRPQLPFKTKYVLVDGGMVANDPALCAYSEAIKFSGVGGIEDMVIVSLGTGKKLREYYYQEVKDFGLYGWSRPVVDIALNGNSQMTDYHLEKIASTVKGRQYYRIEPLLFDAEKEMDSATPENLNNLKEAGKKNADEFDSVLEEIAEILVTPNKPHEYIPYHK
ncbi:patatin-like phospholipase family protein [Microbulbifer variabilis]|uniref:Patatin-like phospholipase family protein n=1 Tax=Microbulbifer variabilis TaxID=266805 RepID=A0ABY4VGM7_9GAMM|nr:patatin-like phospholipase family protein [Microbulbifer variabilis]USD22551.1 patatin-like phospholipase family protein [Microbulbifer variabilis]